MVAAVREFMFRQLAAYSLRRSGAVLMAFECKSTHELCAAEIIEHNNSHFCSFENLSRKDLLHASSHW